MITIHLCISGFTQHEGYLHGVWKLTERLKKTSGCNCKNTRVALHRWDDNWATVAEYYWLLSDYYLQEIRVFIYAYSWGAGWGAMQLANQFSRKGIKVRAMVLSDPVYRHPNIFLRWLSLVGRNAFFSPIIKVPHNVEEVFSLNQTVNHPMGHRLISENGTLIHPTIQIKDTTHQKMADCWLFHGISLEIAKQSITSNTLKIDTSTIKLDNYHI